MARGKALEQQARAARLEVVVDLKRRLFGLDSPESLSSFERHGQALHAKYGHLGLTFVAATDMPLAVDDLFQRMALSPGERLLEIGPGPHGGMGLIAAVLGLRVVIVEIEEPFLVDIDQLRQQLAGVAGTEATLAQLNGLSGTVSVSSLDTLRALIEPYRPLIQSAHGSIDIVAGDFANANVQHEVAALGPFDHLICTDVINPAKGALGTTTAATTTGEAARIESILRGLSSLSRSAKRLSIGVVAPEESDELREEIQRIYGVLDELLTRQDRQPRYDRVIGPSSGSVARCRLYRF